MISQLVLAAVYFYPVILLQELWMENVRGRLRALVKPDAHESYQI